MIRILHLEDVARDAELVVHILEESALSCNIVTVKCGSTFEELAGRNRFDLILSDYNVPGYGGLDAIRFVRSTGSETPIIIISGVVGEDEAVECLRSGAVDYLLKQRLGRLPSAVSNALQTARELSLRKKAELAVIESERFFRSLLNAVSFPIGVLDECGTVMACNNAWNTWDQSGASRWLCPKLGTSYLQVCDKAVAAGDHSARKISRAVGDIFSCRNNGSIANVMTLGPEGRKWLSCFINRFPDGGPVRLTVAYADMMPESDSFDWFKAFVEGGELPPKEVCPNP